jgi:isoamylase
VDKGLTNYWGYQSLGFFAPEPRYLSDGRIADFRHMVDRFHAAGIEVILDVVYNHSGEGDELGPTLIFRGLDNRSYYRLQQNPRYYVNDTGTGNTLNLDHPMVLRMVMDSLRYWVEVMGVDGFRFDLCATLGRTATGFHRDAPFFQAIRQDPVLSRVKLIAEPWDIGPGGYQLGAFPPPFLEWNDRFRDGVRRFWRGDPGRAPDLAERITGSAQQFDHVGRLATSSVNLVTSHDGFTLTGRRHLRRTLQPRERRERAGRPRRELLRQPRPRRPDRRPRHPRRPRPPQAQHDGDAAPLAGHADDPRRRRDRAHAGRQQQRLQPGQPDLLGRLGGADRDFLDFTARMVAFRKAHPILRQKLFLHSRERAIDGLEDLFWWREDGQPMRTTDWIDPSRRLVAVEMRTASGTPSYATLESAVFLVLNAGKAATVTLPEPPENQVWSLRVDTARPDLRPERIRRATVEIAGDSLAAFVLESEGRRA